MIPASVQILHWSHYVAACLFALGLFGFLIRKNAIVVLMCIELMLNAVNLILVEVSMRSGHPEGLIFVIFIITVAAAEAAVGLGIILNLYRAKGTVNIDAFRTLQG
ncbi:MAG: NADH-quinone oxidoreductase subunit NuoK [Bdellovibrionota bacterium]